MGIGSKMGERINLIKNSVVIYLRKVIERKINYNVNKKHFGSSCEKGKVQKMRIRLKSETGGHGREPGDRYGSR
jgi:hypothetical protein